MIAFVKRRIYSIIYTRWDKAQRHSLKKISGYSKLYIIDIDNTLTINDVGSPIDRDNPKPRQGLVDLVQKLIEEKEKVVFLSARDFREFKRTKQWLDSLGIFSDSNELYLVESANSKLPYLRQAVHSNTNVIYIDDLSYNHENGTIKFYSDVIRAVEKLELEYRGKNFIENFD